MSASVRTCPSGRVDRPCLTPELPGQDEPARLFEGATDAQLKLVARVMLRRIQGIAERAGVDLSGHYMHSARAWRQVARAAGARVFSYPQLDGVGEGFYDAALHIIYYQRGGGDRAESRRIVHEVAHHLLLELAEAPELLCLGVERFGEGDGGDGSVQHRAARLVERAVFGVV